MPVDVALRTLNGLALCAGVGTLELGVRLALGDTYRTVGYVERDTFCTSILVARMAEQAMDRAPVWDDLATFNGEPWRGKVDIVTAGFPCQPFSQAGRRRGTDDQRWLWPHIHRIVDQVSPTLVFVENVPPLVKHGLGEVLDDLAASRFDAEWGCLSAADVGATHIRKRLWLLAYRNGARLPVVREPAQRERHLAHRPSGAHVANAGSERRQPLAGSEPATQSRAARRTTQTSDLAVGAIQDVGQRLANTDSTGPQRRLHEPLQRRPRLVANGTRLPRWPPRPDDAEGWDRNRYGPQPSVCRTSDGMAYRLDRLYAIGNGVVPLVAAVALLRLAGRAGIVDELTSAPAGATGTETT